MIRVEDVEPRPALALLSMGELCYIIGAILMQSGDDFTEDELDELAAINAEIVRRERIKQ